MPSETVEFVIKAIFKGKFDKYSIHCDVSLPEKAMLKARWKHS